MNPGAAHAFLNHPSNPQLTGEVRFRIPDTYARIAIGRRLTELVNIGRDKDMPVLNPQDLPYEAYSFALYVSTLEHVIVTAPEGLFTKIDGRLVLTPGALMDFEADEEDGALKLLWAAYHEWRSSFRRARAGHPAGTDGEPGSSPGGERSDPGGSGPAQGAGPA